LAFVVSKSAELTTYDSCFDLTDETPEGLHDGSPQISGMPPVGVTSVQPAALGGSMHKVPPS